MTPKSGLRYILAALSLGTLVGIGVGSWMQTVFGNVALLMIGAGLLGFAYGVVKYRWAAILAAMLCLGLASGTRVGADKVSVHALNGESISAIGQVDSFPRESGAGFSYTLAVSALVQPSQNRSFPLRFSTFQVLERGSVIALHCKIKAVGSRFTCASGSIQQLSHPSKILERLNALRTWLYQKTVHMLPSQNAALLAGMVYGGDDSLPKQTRDNFRSAGLSHLVAVSGANLSVVTIVLYGFLTAALLRRKQAAMVTAILLLITVLFVGADASVLRAATMGWIMLLARYLGRPQSGTNALALAATVMFFMNPWLLYDLGFLLSVSATAGLMSLTKPITKYLQFIPEFGEIRGSVATALAAHLATLPVIAFAIGTVSVVSPLVNVIAVPFVATIFVVGVIWFATLPIPFVPTILAPIVNVLLNGLQFLAALFAKVPGSNMTSEAAIYVCATLSLLTIAFLLKDALSSPQPTGT